MKLAPRGRHDQGEPHPVVNAVTKPGLRRLASSAALSVLFAACGGDSSDVAAAPDAGRVPDASPGCENTGLNAATQLAERDTGLNVLFYTATSAGAMTNRLTLDFYFGLGAPDMAHVSNFSGEDLATCSTCLLAFRGCSQTGCQSATVFLAQSGSLTVSAMGAAGMPLAGSLTDVELAEVTIELGTQKATLVPGGATWCIDSFSFDTPVTAP